MRSAALSRFGHRLAGEAVRRAWEAAAHFGAIHPDSARADRFGRLGEGSLIAFPVTELSGERWMDIGAATLVSRYATLAVGYGPDQVDGLGPGPVLVLGERCVINVRCTILAHHSVVLGDDVWLGRDVFITDANHGYTDLDVAIGRQMGDGEPVSIGAGSWIGHGAVILPGVTIGRHVVVGAGSVVTTDLPDQCVAAGVPARVVRRHHPDLGWVRADDVASADRAEPVAGTGRSHR